MEPDPRSHYAVLRVTPDASRQQIGRAFRALMRQQHPDVGQASDGEEARAILAAFAVLRDPRSRAAYDVGRAAPAAGDAPPVNTADTPRDVPVHHVRHQEPLLRVSRVRWEPNPASRP